MKYLLKEIYSDKKFTKFPKDYTIERLLNGK